jgi:hypothetical protein
MEQIGKNSMWEKQWKNVFKNEIAGKLFLKII